MSHRHSSALLLGLLLFLASSAGLAAGEITRRVEEAYRRTPALEAQFVQRTYVELLDREVEEKGSLTLARPNRFIIHYKGERERKYISDGETLWVWRPREKDLEQVSPLKVSVSRDALFFLTGLGEIEKGFRAKEGGAPKRPTLDLVPRDARSLFKRVVLLLDPETWLVSEATLYPKNGNKSHYRFSRVRRVEKVSNRIFLPPRPSS